MGSQILDDDANERRERKQAEVRERKELRKWSCVDSCCWFIGFICSSWWFLLFLYIKVHKYLVAVMMVAALAAVSSAQDLAPAPAPGPDARAAFSFGVSRAVIFSSLLLSVVSLLKN